MANIINTIIGNLEEKKDYRENEARAKALPAKYAAAYKEIKHYIFQTSGIVTMEPLKVLVDILEEAAANKKEVTDITGTNVAAFADELVKDAASWQDQQRQKLNKKISKS